MTLFKDKNKYKTNFTFFKCTVAPIRKNTVMFFQEARG